MKSMSSATIARKHQLTTGSAWLLLVEMIINGVSYYYTSDLSTTTLDTQDYAPRTLNMSSVRETLNGDVPLMRLQIANADLPLTSAINGVAGSLIGSVILRLVNSTLLSEAAAVEEVFSIVDVAETEEWMTFTLSLYNPIRQRFPRDHYGNICRHRFRGTICHYGFGDSPPKGQYTGVNVSFQHRVAGTDYIQIGPTWPGTLQYADVEGIFATGMILIVTGSTAQPTNNGAYRVDTYTVDATLQWVRFYLDSTYTLTTEANGPSIALTAVCDHTLTMCRLLSNQAQFGGSPGIPEGVYA